MLYRILKLVALAILPCALFAPAFAGGPAVPSNYRRVLVAERIQLSVPAHWTEMDEASRKNLAMFAEAALPQFATEPQKAADLVLTSTPLPSGASIRVSLKPGDDVTQAQLAALVKQAPQELDRELATVAAQVAATMNSTEIPFKVIGKVSATVQPIAGKLAIVMRYQRTSLPPHEGDTYTVTQYHVHLGAKKAVITLSRRDRDAVLWDPILRRVRESVVIADG